MEDDRDLIERAQIRRIVQVERDAYEAATHRPNWLAAEEAKTIVKVLDLVLAQIDARPAGLRL